MNKITSNANNINDLLDIFNLKQNYTANDLDTKEKEYIVNVVSNSSDPQKKYELLMFIDEAKNKLLENLKPHSNANYNYSSLPGVNPNQGVTNPNVNNDIYYNYGNNGNNGNNDIQIGQIINPHSDFPSMQFSNNAIKINGYTDKKIITNYVFNTQYRDDYSRTISTNCSFTLPKKMSNVISIDLSGIQFPNFVYTFNRITGTNRVYIEEIGTGKKALVTIPDGNYDLINFPPTLEKAINEQVVGSYIPGGPNRFQVSISETTRRTTITNTTYPFIINLLIQSSPEVSSYFPCSGNKYAQRFKASIPDDKTGITGGYKYYTLGWLMGFRDDVYAGKKSYTSESIFDNTFGDYVYFVLNDYVGNQTANTYGVFGATLIENNVLGVVPITTPLFSSTFNNNSDFIYKTRNYTGPVNITKISIQLLNQASTLIDLHRSDFAFCLQVTSIYDPYTDEPTPTVDIIRRGPAFKEDI